MRFMKFVKAQSLLGFTFIVCIGVSCQHEVHTPCETEEPSRRYQLKVDSSLQIEIPVEHYPGNQARYDLNTAEDKLLVTTGTDWFYTIDLLQAKVGPVHRLGISRVDKVGTALYHNDDSIFFFHDHPPMAFMTNLDGEVYNSRDMSTAPVSNWYKKVNETLYGFNSFYPQSIPVLSKDQLILLLASEFYYFPKKERVEFLALYDLASDQWSDVFSKAPREYLEDKIETPDSHLFPYVAIDEEHLLVSYPLSHTMQAYKLTDGRIEFVSEGCGKSKAISRFSEMIPLGESNGQRGRDYFVTAPAYGAINYHEAIGVYSRVVRHELPMNDPTVLPALCDRNYSIQIFDRLFGFMDEIYLEQPKNQWAYPIATESGFILRKRCDGELDDGQLDLDFISIKTIDAL